MGERWAFRKRGTIRAKTGVVVLSALLISCAPEPVLQSATSKAANAPASAFLFNLTQTRIVDVSINGVPIGITIAPMEGGQLWKVNAPERMDATSFYGQTLSVTFAGAHPWFETINAGPPPGTPARSVGIWLFRNGCIVSTDTGYIQQVAVGTASIEAQKPIRQ
jgi:hypothetical protein